MPIRRLAALAALFAAGLMLALVSHAAPPCWSNSPHKVCPTTTTQPTTTVAPAPTTTSSPTTTATTTQSTTTAPPTTAPTTTAPSGTVDETLDWETGNTSQTTGLECPSQSNDFALVTSPTRQGSYAARFHLDSSSGLWNNGTPRCLATLYNSGETTGDDYYYALSVYLPAQISPELLWELHHPSSLYNLSGCGVAPFAIQTNSSGGFEFRVSTGNCTVGQGYSYWEPHIPIPNLTSQPVGRWVDFVVHIRFAEDNTGVVEVWSRVQGDPWPSSPAIARYGIPTLPYCNTCGIHNVSLYTEMGLYPGRTGFSSSDSVILDGFRRGSSFTAVSPA